MCSFTAIQVAGTQPGLARTSLPCSFGGEQSQICLFFPTHWKAGRDFCLLEIPCRRDEWERSGRKPLPVTERAARRAPGAAGHVTGTRCLPGRPAPAARGVCALHSRTGLWFPRCGSCWRESSWRGEVLSAPRTGLVGRRDGGLCLWGGSGEGAGLPGVSSGGLASREERGREARKREAEWPEGRGRLRRRGGREERACEAVCWAAA